MSCPNPSWTFLLMLVCSALFACQGCRRRPKKMPVVPSMPPATAFRSGGFNVVFSSEGLGFHANEDTKVDPQHRLALPCALHVLTALIGEPSARLEPPRTSPKGGCTVLTWDDLGIYAHAKPGTSRILHVSIAFTDDYDMPFWPRRKFRGYVAVSGTFINAKSTGADLRSAGLLPVAALPSLWSGPLGKLGVHASVDGPPHPPLTRDWSAETASVISISLGPTSEQQSVANPRMEADAATPNEGEGRETE